MKPGDHVQATKQIVGSKRNVYCEAEELLKIRSVEFLPVLLVSKYGHKERFPVRVENVTEELNGKAKRHIANDTKFKTKTKWQ